MSGTVGELLGRLLAAAGVRQVFGAAVPGLAHHDVADPALAALLAGADGRLGPAPGCAVLPGPTLLLTAVAGGDPFVTPVGDPALLPGVVARAADWTHNDAPGAAAFRLELDLAAPAPAELAPVAAPVRPPVELPDRLPEGTVLLAGPGVVRRGRTERLRRLAEVTGLGVVNTWGAKGLFAWDDPHHLGTIGLQRDDLAMVGLADAPAVVAIGLDPAELPGAAGTIARLVPVPPEQLDQLEPLLGRHAGPIPRPPLFDALSAVCMPSYGCPDVPLHPGRAIIETKGVLGPADRVAADPGGELGLWVARAFPTSFLGSVVVPATVGAGFAAAAALAAALRPAPERVVACALDPLDDATSAVLELAAAAGADLTLAAWAEDAQLRSAGEAGERLAAAARDGGVQVVRLPVDLGRTRELVDVAGPLVAWS